MFESRLPCHSDLRSARVAFAWSRRASHTFVTRFWRLRELRTQIRCAKMRSSVASLLTNRVSPAKTTCFHKQVVSACCGRAFAPAENQRFSPGDPAHTCVTRFWRLRELRTQIRCAKIRSSGREFVTCTRLRADQMCQIRYSVARCAPYALRSHCTPCKSHYRGRLAPLFLLLQAGRFCLLWTRFCPSRKSKIFARGPRSHLCNAVRSLRSSLSSHSLQILSSRTACAVYLLGRGALSHSMPRSAV